MLEARPVCHDRLMRRHTRALGSLTCQTLDVGRGPTRAVAVLCHGYGASGADLMALAERCAGTDDQAPGLRLIVPQGPLNLAGMGMPNSRSWWHLDVNMLEQRTQDPQVFQATLRQRAWDGMPAARKMLRRLVDEALAECNLGYDRLVLAGFSQGAMLSTDVALRLDEPPGGLVVLSGSMVNEAVWLPLIGKRRGLRVAQSHGRGDPILPYANALALRDAFVAAGCSMQFGDFAGGHTIPAVAVRLCVELIDDVRRSA